ncbi:MAG: hypothetical protein GXX96_38095 [Planctomycetaceae bacterium]|nr:hypothetical protein [Planctomycetaceae bacterium]
MQTFEVEPAQERSSYLRDAAFREKHLGPEAPDRRGSREPSRSQIRAMCRAIRKTWTHIERRGRKHGAPDQLTRSQIKARDAAARAVLASKAQRQEIGPPDAIVGERSSPGTTAEPSDRSDGIEATPGPL